MGNAVAAFIIIMGAISSTGWWVTRLARIKHATALASGQDGEAARQVELLSSENAILKSQLVRLEERLGVLERIATDPAERTARDIDALRDR
jgi:hypothetical protein